jgi:hypothetical protein
VIVAHALTEATVDDATTGIGMNRGRSTRTSHASRPTGPTTRSLSTRRPLHGARPWWSHRTRQHGCRDGDHGRARGIETIKKI